MPGLKAVKQLAKEAYKIGEQNRQNASDCLEDSLYNLGYSQTYIKDYLRSQDGITSITIIFNDELE